MMKKNEPVEKIREKLKEELTKNDQKMNEIKGKIKESKEKLKAEVSGAGILVDLAEDTGLTEATKKVDFKKIIDKILS